MIKITYKCLCMPEEKSFHVRYRREGEDVGSWVKNIVQTALTDAHAALSPKCLAQETKWCKIPVTNTAGGIGMKPTPSAPK